MHSSVAPSKFGGDAAPAAERGALGGFTATAFKMEKQQDDSQEIEQPQNHQVVMNRFVAACQADERVVSAFLHLGVSPK